MSSNNEAFVRSRMTTIYTPAGLPGSVGTVCLVGGMPLTAHVGSEADISKHLCDGVVTALQPIAVPSRPLLPGEQSNTGLVEMLAGQLRRNYSQRVCETRQPHLGRGRDVQPGRLDLGSEAVNVGVSMVVCEDDDYISSIFSLQSSYRHNSAGPIGPGIEGVSGRVGEEVNGKHQQRYSQPGEQPVPPRLAKIAAAVREHHPPRRGRRLGADPQECQRALK